MVDPYAYQEDFRKFFWMQRYEDPDLFPNDPQTYSRVKNLELGPLRVSIDSRSPAYSLLFFVASPVFPVLLVNKLLLFPLMLVSVYFLFRIAEKIRGPGTGFALAMAFVVLNLGSPSSTTLAVGLQRSFFTPAILGLVYFLMVRNFTAAVATFVLGGLFYPPVLVIGILVYLLSLFEPADNRLGISLNWRRAIPLFLLVGIATLVLLPAVISQLDQLLNVTLQRLRPFADLLSDPTYMSGGRHALFSNTLAPFVGRAGLFTKAGEFWPTMILGLMALSLLLIRPQFWREFPRPLRQLVFASLIAFTLAWFAILTTASYALYLPSRYTRVSLNLAILIFVVINFEASLQLSLQRLRNLNSRQRLYFVIILGAFVLIMLYVFQYGQYPILNKIHPSVMKWPLFLALIILVGAALLRLLSRETAQTLEDQIPSFSQRGLWIAVGLVSLFLGAAFVIQPEEHEFHFPTPAGIRSLAFIESLPKQTRFMGEPCMVSAVPLLARRSVLWTCENYPVGGTKVIVDTLNAYYAQTLLEVYEFCQQYDIDYMLVNEKMFDQDRIGSGRIFYEPQNSMVYPGISQRTAFALQDVPEALQVYNSDGLIIMACKPDNIILEDDDKRAEIELEASWGDKIGLVDYAVTETKEDNLNIQLRLQALQIMFSSYKVFAHLVDEDTGDLVSQLDVVPLNWTYPTYLWEPYEIITDNLTLTVDSLEPGHYQLWLGVYDENTLERLSLDETITTDQSPYINAIKLAEYER